jgi:hypothetical protein
MARSASDLVLDTKLETTFLPDSEIRHVYQGIGTSARMRVIEAEETWKHKRRLAAGTFGVVWLQECVAGARRGTLRAVKEIVKRQDISEHGYYRELETIAKFSKKKVGRPVK